MNSDRRERAGASPATWAVVAALMPAAAVGVFYFGRPALIVLAVSVTGAMVCEAVFHGLVGREGRICLGRAVGIGLLLGMSLPPAAPAWLALIGSAAAVCIDKLVFGGLGFNPFNPVLAARIFLSISFPAPMTRWSPPTGLFAAAPDAVTAATPLGEVKLELLARGTALSAGRLDFLDGLVGRLPGSIGEVSVIALGLGGAFLIWRGVIPWHIPASFLGSVAALAAIFSAVEPSRYPGPAFHLITGGLVFGSLFMATDSATVLDSPRGTIVYGAGCGLLTWLIRSFGDYPEGVAFAILLMNLCVPLIGTYTRPAASDASAVQG